MFKLSSTKIQPASTSVLMSCSMLRAKSFSSRVGCNVGDSTLPVATLKFAVRHKVPCRSYSNSRRSINPGRAGLVGAVRSRACIPVFSSVLTTCVPAASSCGACR